MRFRSTPPPPNEDDEDDFDLDNYTDDSDEDEAPAAKPSRKNRRGKPAAAAVPLSAETVGAADGVSRQEAPAGTVQGMPALRRRAFQTMSIVFAITAVLVLYVSFRLNQRGQWLPEMPNDFSEWNAAEMPLDRSALQLLGFPPARGHRYENLFGERIDAHLISTATFDAYTEPKLVMAGYGYALTAEKRLPLFDKDGGVRALVLRNETTGVRLLMYYWIQYTDGRSITRGSLRNYADLFPRFRLGVNAVTDPKQSVIVRVYTQIHPADVQGLQARRNMNAIAREIHENLKKQGVHPVLMNQQQKGDAS